MSYCLIDCANFTKQSKEDVRINRMLNEVEKYKEERNSPGKDIRNSALLGGVLGVAPIVSSALVLKQYGKQPKNLKKALLTTGAIGALTGVGTKMLVRSLADKDGKDAKDNKKKTLLKSVGKGTLIGAGLGGVSALRLLGGKYGLKDGLGKALNNVTAGAGIGALSGYGVGKVRNRLKKEDK
jgi:NhaP-type Na+/H+ or K+/H+ antiporter